jgi:hypothetical protein
MVSPAGPVVGADVGPGEVGRGAAGAIAAAIAGAVNPATGAWAPVNNWPTFTTRRAAALRW